MFAGGGAGMDLLPVPDPQGRGAFVGKWNPDGSVAWVRVFQSGYDDKNDDKVGAVTIDAAGAIYFTKFYAVPNDNQLLIVKLDPNGNEIWSRAFSSSNGNGTPYGLVVASDAIGIDAQNHVVIGGRLVGTVNFGGAALDSTPSVPLPPVSPEAYAAKAFVLALTTDGQFAWSTPLGQIANPDSVRLQPSLDGVVVAADQVQPDASYTMALVRVSGGGAVTASHVLSGMLTPNALTVDQMGRIFVAGDASGKVDLGQGGADVGSAGFVAAYGSDLHPIWTDMLPNGSVTGVSADPQGNPAFFASASGMTTFGGKPLDAATVDLGAGGSTFVGKLDAAGSRLSLQKVSDHPERGLVVATPSADILAGHSDGGTMDFTGTMLSISPYFDFVATVCP